MKISKPGMFFTFMSGFGFAFLLISTAMMIGGV